MHNQVKTKLERILNLEKKLLLKKENVRCETFTIGLRNFRYHFRRADLYFLDNTFIIIGFYKFFEIKLYSCLIIISENNVLSNEESLKDNLIKELKIFNLHSSNNNIHIEFGEASFTSTNVTIRLKNLSEKEKKLIKLQQKAFDQVKSFLL